MNLHKNRSFCFFFFFSRSRCNFFFETLFILSVGFFILRQKHTTERNLAWLFTKRNNKEEKVSLHQRAAYSSLSNLSVVWQWLQIVMISRQKKEKNWWRVSISHVFLFFFSFARPRSAKKERSELLREIKSQKKRSLLLVCLCLCPWGGQYIQQHLTLSIILTTNLLRNPYVVRCNLSLLWKGKGKRTCTREKVWRLLYI